MKRMVLAATIAAAVAAPALLAGCDPVEQVDAATLYGDHCAACHGPAGRGDGPAAAGMSPPPSDLTTIAVRNDGVFDYARVMSVIDGYKAPDRSMPRFGDMLAEAGSMPFDAGDGRLTPTPIPLVALAAWIEALQRDASP